MLLSGEVLLFGPGFDLTGRKGKLVTVQFLLITCSELP